MKKWPATMDEMLKANEYAALKPHEVFSLDNKLTPYLPLPKIVKDEIRPACLEFLEKLWPIMKRYPHGTEMSPGSEADVNLDYKYGPFCARHYQMYCPLQGEITEDTVQDAGGSKADNLRDVQEAFVNTGIYDFFKSDSVMQFAERVTGYPLTRDMANGILLVCYTHGDYISPHTDVRWSHDAGWSKENKSLGYVNIYMSFPNDAVQEQWIVVQNGRQLNKVYGGRPPLNGNITVDRLPYWHYSTPLQGKPGSEHEARRWLLMVSYAIDSTRADATPKLLSTG